MGNNRTFLFVVMVFLVSVGVFVATGTLVRAFNGPGSGNNPPPAGSGAVGVNSSNNLSVGTSTPLGNTKFLIVASSSADNANYSLKILYPNSNPILVVRNDGEIGIGTASPGYTLDVNGTVNATTLLGNWSGTLTSNNVTNGVFGSCGSCGGGNYAFPSELNVGTSSNANLSTTLYVRNTSNGVGLTLDGTWYGGHDWLLGDGLTNNGYFQLKDSTANAVRLTVDSSGNVGIGTTNPANLLNLYANSATASGQLTSPGALVLTNVNGSAGVGGTIAFQANGATNVYTEAAIRSNNTDSDATGGIGNLEFLTKTNKTDTTLSTRMVIDPSGNVGIGTTNPQSVLDLGSGTNGRSLVWGGGSGANWYGTIGTSHSNAALDLLSYLKLSTASPDQMFYSFTGTDAASGIRLDGGNAGDISFFNAPSAAQTAGTVFDPVANTKMIIKSSGNVGIGTVTPVARLEVGGPSNWGSSPQEIRVDNSSGNSTFRLGQDGTHQAYLNWFYNSTAANAYVALSTYGGNNPLVLQDAGGYVGIATTSPAYALDVNGTVRATSFIGSFSSATINANNVTNGVFGSCGSCGGGIYAFPSELNVGTSSNANLSTTLYVRNAANGVGLALDGTWYGGHEWLLGDGLTTNGYFQLKDSTANAVRLTVDSSGNVGIGTSAPGAPLQVNTASGNSYINVTAPAGSYGFLRLTSGSGLWDIRTNSTGASGIGGAADLSIGQEGGNSQVVIQSGSGNVGIATTNPGYTLTVAGQADIISPVGTGLWVEVPASSWGIALHNTSSTDNPTNSPPIVFRDNNGQNIYFAKDHNGLVVYDANSTYYAHIAASSTDYTYFNNIAGFGIGTASPQAPLEVYSALTGTSGVSENGFIATIVDPTSASTAIYKGLYSEVDQDSSSSVNGEIDSVHGYALQIGTGAMGTMIGVLGGVQTDQNAGTVTTAYGVSGSIQASSSISSAAALHGSAFTVASGSTVTNGYGLLIDNMAGSATNAYEIYVNTPTACYYNGNGATAWSCPSDIRLKTDVTGVTNALGVLNELNPVQFHYKKDLTTGYPYFRYGFIAQQYQKVFPGDVSTGPDGYLALAPDSVVPYLVAADKEFSTVIHIGADGTLALSSSNNVVAVSGGVQLATAGKEQPACASSTRGTFWTVQSPSGDAVQACVWTGSDYAWKAVMLK